MDNVKGWTKEEWENLIKEHSRRYSTIDEKVFEYRGYHGHAILVHDNDTGTDEWCGKEASSWHRFYGNTLEEVEADFRYLVDGLINELGFPERG